MNRETYMKLSRDVLEEAKTLQQNIDGLFDRYYEREDNRPLTEETLKDLGFKCIANKNLGNPHYDLIVGNVTIYASHDTIQWYVHIGTDTPAWKTIGKVKMLIESLKIDE